MIIDESDYLMHYGVLRKSGRYPWGSGNTQDARNKSFLDHVDGLRKSGMSETDIAKGMGITTTELRAAKSIAKNEQKQADIARAQRLKEHGYSNVEIGKRMEINESSVRSLLEPGQKDRNDVLQATSEMLRKQVEEKGYIDIGTGVERHLAISDTKLKTAVAVLREEGYTLHYVKVTQLGTGKQTTIKVLAAPDTPYKDVFNNRDKIRQITEFSDDGGRTFLGIKPPVSVNSKRVAIRYAEEGGTDADGVIYIRPGVKDLSLGSANYAQVRIAVDGTHYLKGMAMYKDDLPPGVDLMFNTNKSDKGDKLKAMKEMKTKSKDDPTIDLDNPFGAVISRQSGVMNIVNEEGDWGKWSKSLSSQMLSKQSPNLAKTQLDMTYERKKQAFDEINALTNPAVKRKLLESMADDLDSSAVHLKAAALPRQASHVILPINTLKENEIYAPNYRNGERVALVRYPHGGKFEIPELTVNNNHPDSKKALGRATDAVGINAKVAARLSGADFDGDTVLVIPNNNKAVKTEPALAGLKGFDGQAAYPAYPGMKKMSARTKAIEMGVVSNLITDMTIRGASSDELARAVRHSMVVIDAEKHNLNYKQSAVDNGISALKQKYQDSSRGGASTLISRASSPIRVPEIAPRSAAKGGPIDKETGKLVFEQTGTAYTNGKGQLVTKTTSIAKLAATPDANTLSSGTPIEKVYADHSNKLKSLANQARLNMMNTRPVAYSPSAKAAYSAEVATLNAKLNLALRNKPMERQAQLVANTIVTAKKTANPDMDAAELKKIKGQALNEARNRVGAKKERIDITDTEWSAIQAGAISNSKLEQILSNADLDQVKALATPRTPPTMTSAKASRALSMLNNGYTQAEVADALGISVSTLKTGIV